MNSSQINRKRLVYALVIIIIILLIYITNHQFVTPYIFDYPLEDRFSPSIWGTFADWAMVFVTSLTAIYIYQTLTSQKEVGRQQLITTRIALDQHRQSIMPRIVLDQDIGHNGNMDEEFYAGHYNGKTRILNIGQLARNIKLTIYQGDLENPNRKVLISVSVKELDNRKSLAFDYKYSQLTNSHNDRLFELYWTYEDILGNSYYSTMIKYFSINPRKTKTRLDINVPMLIKLAV
jgi:hypothetical protein